MEDYSVVQERAHFAYVRGSSGFDRAQGGDKRETGRARVYARGYSPLSSPHERARGACTEQKALPAM